MLLFQKRLFAVTLAFTLLFQLIIPAQSFAAVENKLLPSSGLKEPQINLEQAIQIVKENFSIPKEFSNFTSGFSNFNYRQSWSLTWNGTGDYGGSFSSQVDALSGEILNIYSWKSSPSGQTYTLPTLSLEQARTMADNLVKKLVGQKYANLKMIEKQNLIPIIFYGQNTYTFVWQRMENGIPVQGNGVNLQLDSSSGQVTSYSLTWNDLLLPAKEGIIDIQKATSSFSENKMLELQYYLPPEYRIMAAGTKEQVQLIYQLNKNGYIDAFSGKPLALTANQWVSAIDLTMGGMGTREAYSSNKTVPLTPQEQKEIDLNTTLITKEAALIIVNKWLEIPSSLSLRTINLFTDSGSRNSKVWYFEWTSSNQTAYESITARVDAVSGELMSFYVYNSPSPLASGEGQKAKLTREEGRKIAEDFLQRIQPTKFQQVRLQGNNLAEADAKIMPETTSLAFNYQRIVTGIVFPSNGMDVNVDPVTKQITSYNLNWWNLDFPRLSQALPQNSAETSFLDARPLTLQYLIVYNNGEPKEAKLVYQPSTEGNISDIMDAKTGYLLNWQGKPLSEQPRAYHFTDIAGHLAEKEITALGLAGIFGEFGNSFKPAEQLTAVSFLKSLLMIRNGSQDSSLTSEEVMTKSKELGWLKEDLTPLKGVSRELFSKIIIRYLGLEKIAGLNGIYQPSFLDADQIPLESQGYVSLTVGLNILPTENNIFAPDKIVTRAEAAHSIIRALGYGLRF